MPVGVKLGGSNQEEPKEGTGDQTKETEDNRRAQRNAQCNAKVTARRIGMRMRKGGQEEELQELQINK